MNIQYSLLINVIIFVYTQTCAYRHTLRHIKRISICTCTSQCRYISTCLHIKVKTHKQAYINKHKYVYMHNHFCTHIPSGFSMGINLNTYLSQIILISVHTNKLIYINKHINIQTLHIHI
jgi:hypothetical protein